MRARRHACGFNDITVIGRNKLSIKRIFDAGDVLISLDAHHNLGGVRQRCCEQVGRQGQQGDWNRRPQDGAAGCALSVCCGNVQRKAVAAAISWDGRIYRDDVLRAEQIGKIAVDGDQFLWPGRIIKNGIRFAGDRFQETLVDVPAQSDSIDWRAMNGRRPNALLAGIAADIAIFTAIAQNDDGSARQGRLERKLNALSVGVVQGGFSTGVKLVNNAKQFGFVGGVIDKQFKGRVKNSKRNLIIGAQGRHITARGCFGLFQWETIHTAAGINHQRTGECQVVIGDIFHPTDTGNPGQITANIKIARIQPGNKLSTGIQYAGIDDHRGQVSRINTDDVNHNAGFILHPHQAKRQQQYQRRHRSPSKSLHVELLQCLQQKIHRIR